MKVTTDNNSMHYVAANTVQNQLWETKNNAFRLDFIHLNILSDFRTAIKFPARLGFCTFNYLDAESNGRNQSCTFTKYFQMFHRFRQALEKAYISFVVIQLISFS